MTSARLRPGRDFRLRLLAGSCAVACTLAAPALAQQTQTTPGPDGLTPDALYIEADAAQRDGNVITATSSASERVLARFRGATLRAGSVAYDLDLGTATADDRVEFLNPDGTRVFASHLELDGQLNTGVAVDFATRFADGSSLMAATAVRRSANVNQLNYAIFTPCPICDAEGRAKEPTISIKAEQVVQDENLRAVLYRNAIFRVGGVPVFFLPVFAHPDPTVEAQSGFLTPTIAYDQGRGLSVETPYVFVVSPSQDILVSPQFNTRVAPLLNLQWRRRFTDGIVVLRGGYTHEAEFGDRLPTINESEDRSYLLGYGRFDPSGPWRWGFTTERASDKTLFDQYDVRDVYQDHGLYYGDRRRLISQLYAERQTERSYVSAAVFSIQSLRLDPARKSNFKDSRKPLVFEDDGTLPLVAPLIEARWEPSGPVLGGRLRLRGSAVSLSRQDYVGAPVLRPALSMMSSAADAPGVDSRRVSAQAEWRRVMLSAAGVRWEPFVDLRADAYSIGDLPPALGVDDASIGRGRATAGVDVSYPLIRRLDGGADLILEPMGQLSASTDPDLDPRIPNEDSQTLELDESSLFRVDRFPGYDLYEGGVRLTAGARATLRWDGGRQASLFVGRSLRDNEQPDFRAAVPDAPSQTYDPSGLASTASDWVVQGSFSPSDRLRGWGHATLDSAGGVRRAEVAVDGRWGQKNLIAVSYIVDRSDPIQIDDRPDPNEPGETLPSLNRNYEFIQASGQQFVRGPWGVAFSGISDLQRGVLTRSEIGLLFDDDCVRFEIGYRRDNTAVRPTGPSEGAYVRLNLATFGGTR